LRSHRLDVATSYLACAFRGAAGINAGKLGPRPKQRLELYEFEACPFCRKVREALTALDLEAVIYPTPKGGTRYRPVVLERGGQAMFPYLVDPNTETEMYESDDIIAYLYERYGSGSPPLSLRLGPLTYLSSTLASMSRGMSGFRSRAGAAPEQPLELWSMEGSPFCRLARETLTELEVPYVLHNVAHGSPSREAFVAVSGRMQVPYLVDPNTGASMFESADIVRYLEKTYARA